MDYIHTKDTHLVISRKRGNDISVALIASIQNSKRNHIHIGISMESNCKTTSTGGTRFDWKDEIFLQQRAEKEKIE